MSLPGVLIDSAWLHSQLGAPDLLILDATVELPAPRFDGDYRASSGYAGWVQARIPGARHADLLEALADTSASFSFAMPAAEALLEGLAALGLEAQKRVVIYDRADGFWAARLWWMLRSVGIAAGVLDGGFRAWVRGGFLVEGGTEGVVGMGGGAACDAPATSLDSRLRGNDGVTRKSFDTFPPKTVIPAQAAVGRFGIRNSEGDAPRNNLWITRPHVEAITNGQAPGTLICALGTALFDGSAPSRYKRRGHIPGSLNLPARTLFDEQGRYLPKDALAHALAPALLHPDEPLILYCGGGISAAATALALTLLGREHVAIYDGSLQEWAADARLPMTTGAAPA